MSNEFGVFVTPDLLGTTIGTVMGAKTVNVVARETRVLGALVSTVHDRLHHLLFTQCAHTRSIGATTHLFPIVDVTETENMTHLVHDGVLEVKAVGAREECREEN